MITNQDVLDYLLIDDEEMAQDDMVTRRIDRCINAAEAWIKEASTPNVDMEDPLAEELLIKAAGELYENRSFTEKSGVTGKVAAALNRMASDFTFQLRLKYGGDE